jgi:Fe-Mn family superoxide dismutase
VYQNRRPDYAQDFIDHLINWDFVSQQYAAATA